MRWPSIGTCLGYQQGPQGIFPGTGIYSPGNIPWGIFPRQRIREYSPGHPGEYSWGIFLGEYSRGIFLSQSPGNIPGNIPHGISQQSACRGPQNGTCLVSCGKHPKIIVLVMTRVSMARVGFISRQHMELLLLTTLNMDLALKGHQKKIPGPKMTSEMHHRPDLPYCECIDTLRARACAMSSGADQQTKIE